MSPPTTTPTLPLTPPFSPTTTTTQHSFHPLSRVETLELDGPSIHEEEEDEDYTDDESDSDEDEHDQMRPAYSNNINNAPSTKQQFMDGEGEGVGGWKEKGTGGTGKLRVVIVTGESSERREAK